MSCVSKGATPISARPPYRREGPPLARRRRLPIVAVSMLALSLAVCLGLTVGMIG